MSEQADSKPYNPPAFNLPASIVVIGAILVLVHIVRTVVLTFDQNLWALNAFAFVPFFYSVEPDRLVAPLSLYWTPVTHGLLHGDWTHLIVNLVWLAAFGSAVARRFGAVRFVLFMVLATGAGALAHYIFHSMSNSPVVGASGAVSACMGAAIRFAFVPGRPIAESMIAPAQSLIQSLMNRRIMTFVILWFALNWVFGSGLINLGIDAEIAWEAHMGGFLFGWLAFAFFDRKLFDRQPVDDHPIG